MSTVGFYCGVNDVFAIMGYYTPLIGSWFTSVSGKLIGPTVDCLIFEYGTDKLS
jgi:hypothetical protein